MKVIRIVGLAALIGMSAVAAATAQAAEIKIGVFDFQRVSEETARGQELQASLAKFRDKKQEEIAAKENELKALKDQYAATALGLSGDKRAQMEKEIQKKELDLQSAKEAAQREMQLELTEAQQKFQEELFRVVNDLGRERGYSLIFVREQIVYAAAAVDMTGEVIERFNQEKAKAAPPAPETKPGPAAGDVKPAPPKAEAPKAPAPKGSGK